MNKIIALILIVVLAACSTEKTAEQLNAEITKTRGKIAQLNQDLADMESQLAKMDTEDLEKGIAVVVDPLVKGNFASFISTSATVEAAKSALVNPEMNGRIKSIHVTEGQKVSKGQLLISLDSEIMSKGIEELETGLALTKTLYEKQKGLWDQGVGSEMQYLQAKNSYESMLKTKETLESQMKMGKIYAPFSGYVEQIFMKTGELATPGRQILQIINLDNLYINTQLSEAYINSIHKGDTVNVEFPDVPGLKKSIPISNTGNTIDPMSRTFSIRLNMKNVGEKVKPNMMATLKLQDYSAEDVIIVPTQMIRQDLKGFFVYLARPHDGEYFGVKTYVTVGRSDGRQTIVEQGLKAGDALIVEGYNQIKDGSKLSITQK